jgi:hypothetical protein
LHRIIGDDLEDKYTQERAEAILEQLRSLQVSERMEVWNFGACTVQQLQRRLSAMRKSVATSVATIGTAGASAGDAAPPPIPGANTQVAGRPVPPGIHGVSDEQLEALIAAMQEAIPASEEAEEATQSRTQQDYRTFNLLKARLFLLLAHIAAICPGAELFCSVRSPHSNILWCEGFGPMLNNQRVFEVIVDMMQKALGWGKSFMGGTSEPCPEGRQRWKRNIDRSNERQTAFFKFAEEKQDVIRQQHPGLNQRQLMAAAGKMWSQLSAHEQRDYATEVRNNLSVQ